MKHLTAEQLRAVGVDVAHHFGGGAYIKETRLPAGTMLGQHAHVHDHLSVLMQGSVRLIVDGVAQEISAPEVLTLSAGRQHEVQALSDALWLCVWGTDETDPALVDAAVSGG